MKAGRHLLVCFVAMWNATGRGSHENLGSFKDIFYLVFGICAGITNTIGFLGNAYFIRHFYRYSHLFLEIFVLSSGILFFIHSSLKQTILKRISVF